VGFIQGLPTLKWTTDIKMLQMPFHDVCSGKRMRLHFTAKQTERIWGKLRTRMTQKNVRALRLPPKNVFI
jgi:hypothetical protein